MSESIVEAEGLRFDRRWMLVDENGDFLTQREFPKMATIKVLLKNDHLQVSDESENLLIPFAENIDG